MNKTSIKNFAIWARNKLIADIQYRAGLMGITAEDIKPALPQSTAAMEFYDIGTAEPYAISGNAIRQRNKLVEIIRQKERDSDYPTAYKYILEEVAYTWFNRLIAIRFMEVNDYLPSHIRVLSSESGKVEPDLVTTPFDAGLTFSPAEEETILRLKTDNQMDELFRLLFVKQCNALSEILPALFEPTSDYTELLLNLSVVDQEGVIYHLVHDIDEDDFNVEKGGQVEIIGWLYQYYNTEPKNAAFAKNGKITKEEIPAVTQLFTPDWIVRYMVENSLGRTVINNLNYDLWADSEKEKINQLKSKWKYYLDEAEQDPDVDAELRILEHEKYGNDSTRPLVDVTVFDPCMGSGHILVYAFEVLMQIYESQGWSQRDAAQSILEHNLYGLDIDDRAAQLAYFAVMMKARQYDRRILNRGIRPNLFSVVESDGFRQSQLQYFGQGLSELERNNARNQAEALIDTLRDAKDFGSLVTVDNMDWDLLRRFADDVEPEGQIALDSLGLEDTQAWLNRLIDVGELLARQYDVVVTNPPYMAVSNGNAALNKFVKENYPDSKGDLFACFMERCGRFTKENGYQAMITQHAWMFLSSFEKLRTKLLQSADIVNMAHLGPRAFEDIGGEVVQTTSFVLRRSHIDGYQGTYCRLIEPTTQQGKEKMFLAGENRYTAQQSNFSKIPGAPVAYWVSEAGFKVFDAPNFFHRFMSGGRNKTHNNELYVRAWWETIYKDFRWQPYSNGGEHRKWFGNNIDIVDWSTKARDFYASHGGLIAEKYWDIPAITWNDITSGKTSFRIKIKNSKYSSVSPTLIAFNGKYDYTMLAFLNSVVAEWLNNITNPTLHTLVGNVLAFPDKIDHINTDTTSKDCVELSKRDWDSYETSWDFKRHPLV